MNICNSPDLRKVPGVCDCSKTAQQHTHDPNCGVFRTVVVDGVYQPNWQTEHGE